MIAATRDPSSRQGNLLTSGQQRPEPAEGAHYGNIDRQWLACWSAPMTTSRSPLFGKGIRREYSEVLPEMAETAGVSRSRVSRQAIEGSVEQLRELRERRWAQADLLVLYIDGQRFGSHHVISAVGVDRNGSKHVLGIQVGATENAAAVKLLLTNLREQGLPTDRKYLFVIDGAKARKCLARTSRCSVAAITR